jgi:hypothetical protein
MTHAERVERGLNKQVTEEFFDRFDGTGVQRGCGSGDRCGGSLRLDARFFGHSPGDFNALATVRVLRGVEREDKLKALQASARALQATARAQTDRLSRRMMRAAPAATSGHDDDDESAG